MVLNKLFGKKQDNYFFEAQDSTANQPQTSGEATISETESDVAATVGETSATPVASTPQTNVPYDVPDWVKAIKNYSNQDVSNNNQPQGDNFAGKYVTNNVPFSRRRPGPSLAPFKSMASKIGK